MAHLAGVSALEQCDWLDLNEDFYSDDGEETNKLAMGALLIADDDFLKKNDKSKNCKAKKKLISF
ncbi:hypothetical protein KFK09_019240 [Dendrobium nobile]|uniref:Uncharacterized protein n=1 Tax=Dendrobium nobile TaxID=94219 RepID=A0A8T3AZF4_DENNO|nr:hypothetical protein KFK09_019240 [Dendrobium nobile]